LCDAGAAVLFTTGMRWLWVLAFARTTAVGGAGASRYRETYPSFNSAYPVAATSSHRARYAGALPL
jgi:hypothetical protein